MLTTCWANNCLYWFNSPSTITVNCDGGRKQLSLKPSAHRDGRSPPMSHKNPRSAENGQSSGNSGEHLGKIAPSEAARDYPINRRKDHVYPRPRPKLNPGNLYQNYDHRKNTRHTLARCVELKVRFERTWLGILSGQRSGEPQGLQFVFRRRLRRRGYLSPGAREIPRDRAEKGESRRLRCATDVGET